MCQHTQVQPRQRRLASRLHTSLCLLCTSVRHARSDTKNQKQNKKLDIILDPGGHRPQCPYKMRHAFALLPHTA